MSLKITYNNIVKPVKKTVNGFILESKAVDQPVFNYNTYVMLTPLFKSLIVSSNNKGGDYYLRYDDDSRGFYFEYKELNIFIKVPLNAVFNTNEKLGGILGIFFTTARECPSNKRGLCQLDESEDCYALQGEKQGSKKSWNYLEGMGSYFKGLLATYYWNLFNRYESIKKTMVNYLKFYNVNKIRFNLRGDFRDVDDINALEYLAKNQELLIYGYTARDDLFKELIELITNNSNIIINGSNVKYNNRFYVTNDLKEYLTAKYNCKGECLKCGNCFKNRGAVIYALIHGSGSDTKLKTLNNIKTLCNLLNKAGCPIKPGDFKDYKTKGLLSTLNKWLIDNNYKPFKGVGSAKMFRNYLIELYKTHGGI